MDNIKNDSYYIQKIIKDLTFVTSQMQNVDIDELNANEILPDSMLFRMIQISENSKSYPTNTRKITALFLGMPSTFSEISSFTITAM